ncbi:MAG: molybdenum ABC transporter permease [Anaerolineales bacterium]|nr:ABC transporter permease subunit [Anaerolineae bacterium]PWB55110.1 MAG: molybdenum ABC transporter permease [Anaerolineales bacterium]
MNRRDALNLIFSFLAGLLVLFVILPLISTLLSTTPGAFLNSFTDPEVVKSICLTFGAAAICTVFAMVMGIPLAYILARRMFHGKRLLEAIINLPVVIPHTAAGIALLLVFGRQGLLGKWFYPLGITFTDNLAGIVVAMLFVSLPFLINLSRESFSMVDEEYEKVAFTDGASHWQAFLHVTLPLAWRGVLAGAVMMWSRGISEFGAVVILAYHPKVATVLVYERFAGFGLDAAQPIALILILVALVVFISLRLVLLPDHR